MTTTQTVTPHLLIGAIRWDAWYDPSNGSVAQAVETDLDPKQFLSSAPNFATVNANGTLTINGDTQAEMTQEIQDAKAAGINYWAFDYYGGGDPMDNALQLYLQNPLRSEVDFSLIDTAGWGATSSSFSAQIANRASLMEQPTYQCVEGNRPLYYLMVPSTQIVDQWWGGNAANMKAAVDALRGDVIKATGANPYIVVMGSPVQAAAFAQSIGADAISAYAIEGGDQNASYQTLTNETEAGWNAELATGQSVVPTVMTGWNSSPRTLNPVPWGSDGTATYATATPTQIAAQLSSALAWLLAHPGGTAGTALVYAWNEFDEGGSLAPTYVASNPQGDTSRLAALAAVTALYQGAAAVQNADGSFSVTLGNGSVEHFSAAGALLEIVAADSSATVYNADNSISKYNPAGRLVEVDRADGTTLLYGSDGSRTYEAVNGSVTKIVAADGSSKTVWSDGWLWFSASGTYLQHEVDLSNGSKQFYNAAGHLTEGDNANGTKTIYGTDGSQSLYAASGVVTKFIAADGSSKVAWTDGWLWYDSKGNYLQHESDLANGSKDFYNAAGHLTEIVAADGNVSLTGATIGLSAPMVFINPSTTTTALSDQGSGMEIVFSKASTSLQLLNLTQDPAWKLDMTGGVGGFGTVQALIAAFHSDGHGGALLSLPGGVSVDLVGVTPASLTPGHFLIQAVAPAI